MIAFSVSFLTVYLYCPSFFALVTFDLSTLFDNPKCQLLYVGLSNITKLKLIINGLHINTGSNYACLRYCLDFVFVSRFFFAFPFSKVGGG